VADNVRQRVTQHMQATGENSIARVFEPVADEQIAAFLVQMSKLRMDSTLIAGSIRQATRLQLLVEALRKHGQGRRGCVANVSETCHPENPFRLMVNVQREPNATDDAALLAAAWTGTAERSDVDGLHTDGGDHSPQVDDLMHPPSRAAGADLHPRPSTDGGQGRPGGHDPADERRHRTARVGRLSRRTARRGCGWAQRRTLHGDL